MSGTRDAFVEGKLMVVVIRPTLQKSWTFSVSSFWCSCYVTFCISKFIYEWSTHCRDSRPFLELCSHFSLYLGMAITQVEPKSWTFGISLRPQMSCSLVSQDLLTTQPALGTEAERPAVLNSSYPEDLH